MNRPIPLRRWEVVVSSVMLLPDTEDGVAADIANDVTLLLPAVLVALLLMMLILAREEDGMTRLDNRCTKSSWDSG